MSSQSHLFQLIAAYLGQDMDLWADTEEAAIELFTKETGQTEMRGVLADVAALRSSENGALREVFMANHGGDFDPGPTDQDVLAFLDKVETTVRNALGAG